MDYTYRFADGEGSQIYDGEKLIFEAKNIPKNVKLKNISKDISEELESMDRDWYRLKQGVRENEDYERYGDVDDVVYEQFKDSEEDNVFHYRLDGEPISDELGRFLASLSEPQLKTIIAKYRYGSNHKVAKELSKNRKTVINSLNLIKEKAINFEDGKLYGKIQDSSKNDGNGRSSKRSNRSK